MTRAGGPLARGLVAGGAAGPVLAVDLVMRYDRPPVIGGAGVTTAT